MFILKISEIKINHMVGPSGSRTKKKSAEAQIARSIQELVLYLESEISEETYFKKRC